MKEIGKGPFLVTDETTFESGQKHMMNVTVRAGAGAVLDLVRHHEAQDAKNGWQTDVRIYRMEDVIRLVPHLKVRVGPIEFDEIEPEETP